MIRSEKEGRRRRYYQQRPAEKLRISHAERQKKFRDWIVKLLKEEALKPKVLVVKDREIKVQIEAAGKSRVLIFNTDPMSRLR